MSPAAPGERMGLTRWRDLAAVLIVAGLIGYLLLRWSYHRVPPLPRLAGVPAAVIGVGELIVGRGLRRRILHRDQGVAPVEPLVAARAVAVAKATSLAAAAFGGLWLGELAYVTPMSGEVTAAAADRATGVIGVACSAIMLVGGLVLERCCRTPDDGDSPDQDRPGTA